MASSKKRPKFEKARQVISKIIQVISILVCCASVLLGVAVLILSFINNVSAGLTGTIGTIFHALNKWYIILALIVGGPIALFIGMFISFMFYMPENDGDKKSAPKRSALIPGSVRMYLKGDLFGCTNCTWTAYAGDDEGPVYKCKKCGSYNCQIIYGAGAICKDCGSLDTDTVCPKCGHDIAVNKHPI